MPSTPASSPSSSSSRGCKNFTAIVVIAFIGMTYFASLIWYVAVFLHLAPTKDDFISLPRRSVTAYALVCAAAAALVLGTLNAFAWIFHGGPVAAGLLGGRRYSRPPSRSGPLASALYQCVNTASLAADVAFIVVVAVLEVTGGAEDFKLHWKTSYLAAIGLSAACAVSKSYFRCRTSSCFGPQTSCGTSSSPTSFSPWRAEGGLQPRSGTNDLHGLYGASRGEAGQPHFDGPSSSLGTSTSTTFSSAAKRRRGQYHRFDTEGENPSPPAGRLVLVGGHHSPVGDVEVVRAAHRAASFEEDEAVAGGDFFVGPLSQVTKEE